MTASAEPAGAAFTQRLKAAIEQMSPMDCPQHKIVSLTGNIAQLGKELLEKEMHSAKLSLARLVKQAAAPKAA